MNVTNTKTETGANLLQVQDSGLHPGHLHLLVHLVDVALDQAHGQGLHHQELHLQDTSTDVVKQTKKTNKPETILTNKM